MTKINKHNKDPLIGVFVKEIMMEILATILITCIVLIIGIPLYCLWKLGGGCI